MTDLADRKCPVCGTRGPKWFNASLLVCAFCGTTDSVDRFVDAGPAPNPDKADEQIFSVALDHQSVLTQFYPPDHIVAAVKVIEDYFVRERGAREWAYGPIQSRDPDTPHPNLASVGLSGVVVGPDIRMSDVRRLAAAFRCDVLPRPGQDRYNLIAERVYETFDDDMVDSQHDVGMPWDNNNVVPRQETYRKLVRGVGALLGFD